MDMKNLKVTMFMFVVSVVLQVAFGQHSIRCIPKERDALLQFKAAIVDHNGMLSSWTTPDCCQWEGIRCTNLTAHIISLHLSGQYNESLSLGGYVSYEVSQRYIGGEIHKSLMELRQLQYLNLSFNYFRDTNIPEFLGSLTNLRYLDLSSCDFSGQIPNQISSLSHLKYLNLARNYYLEGSIPPQLGNLSRLEYLDLSWNSFEGYIPSQLGNLSRLQYLDLSYNSFEGYIPPQLGNLSNLNKLYLGGYHSALKIATNDQWLSNLNSLTHLSFNSISNFNSSTICLRTIAKLPTLRELSLIHCGLSDDFLLSFNPSNFNFSHSLSILRLSFNSFTQPRIFQWLSNTTTNLVELDVRGNLLKGSTSYHFGLAMNSLEHLDVSQNVFKGEDMKLFMNICTLRSLHMSRNNMTEDLSLILHNFSSGCVRYSLQEFSLASNQIQGSLPDLSVFSSLKILDLSSNQLRGKIPDFSISKLETLNLSMNQISGTLPNTLKLFPSLKRLYLDNNMLNGTISEDLRFPTELEELSLMSNSLKGVLSDSHFYNMTKLKTLMLSDNSLTLEVSQNWGSTFQLDNIELRSCKLGPLFPKWLEKQNKFQYLDISNSGISGTVPKWFWTKFGLSNWMSIDISFNNLQGTIPNLPIENHYDSLSLASNQFEGHVPSFLQGSIFLDLSNNKFTNSSWFLCSSGAVDNLYQLDLSNNEFSGQIPDCWTHFKSLAYLDMSQNKFSKKIPTSMRSLLQLQVLLLRNNNLTGMIPSILKNCTNLVMVDIAGNRLSGSIPDWIGNELSKLQFLSLRSNYLWGSLPLQICYLKRIQLLDLSLNNLSGQIPKCIKNFSSMAQMTSLGDYQSHQYLVHTRYMTSNYSYNLNTFLMWKGSELMFTNIGLSLLKSIDFSDNELSGEIPKEIEGLFGLVSLNLSRNQLTGKIPLNVGELTSLEFLDLSRNQLVGSIPSSLAQIDRLTVLDLSHNYLSGKIPTGTQLQSFDASKYEDNVDLCGPPLKKWCIDGVAREEPIVKFQEDDNLIFNREYYISMTIGFVISFWGVFGSILIIRSWRHAYFKFLIHLSDTFYGITMVKVLKKLHTTWRGNLD